MQIVSAFSDRDSFSINDVLSLLGGERSSTYWLLSNLSRSGKLQRTSRGVYTLNRTKDVTRGSAVEPRIQDALQNLIDEGVSCVLTGLDILLPYVQHQPARVLHLLYTATGAGSWAHSLLKSDRVTPILNPSRQEIDTVIDINDDRTEIIIIRERASMLASKNSLATVERAFVDLYFETSRETIPFPLQETAYILQNLTAVITINEKQMIRYANERSISDEIDQILRFLNDPRTDISSKSAQRFLSIYTAIR